DFAPVSSRTCHFNRPYVRRLTDPLRHLDRGRRGRSRVVPEPPAALLQGPPKALFQFGDTPAELLQFGHLTPPPLVPAPPRSRSGDDPGPPPQPSPAGARPCHPRRPRPAWHPTEP